MPDVTKFVRYYSHVTTITEAWSFVMERMDEFDRPAIEVKACSNSYDEGQTWTEGFDALIYGEVTEDENDA